MDIGTVYLVGSGPGDAGLITVRGVECLRNADVVLYDYLANPELLEHLPQTAERICLGRHGTGKIMPQEEITARLIDEARAGKTVVRLKSGDPTIFARISEEVPALAAAGISYEIVPGITAAWAAASHAGFPLTDRDAASAVALVAGQQRDDQTAAALDYDALAQFPGTLVFYMGVTTAGRWSRALLAAGKPADTPVAVLRRVSWPDQQTVRCRLDEIADVLDQSRPDRIRPPAIVIVGAVAGASELWSWFSQRPLFGQTVLITRPAEQAASLRRPLGELGAHVLMQPAIEIASPTDWQPVDEALGRLGTFDWIVFSSVNGVRYLLSRLCDGPRDLRQLGRAKLAAIGPGTADELARWNLRADLVPDEYRAESLAEALAAQAAGKRFLLVRASRGREVLREELTAADGTVEQIVVYNSEDVAQPSENIADELVAGRIDWITVTSSAIARSLGNLFGNDLHRAKLVSISPITSATLQELGFKPRAEAETYTMQGVVDAILCETNNKKP